ncbi:tetratricopeptide repeat protein [Amantichitinum ursilacus]|uniref:PelB C-terminal domain-containing protein n=1 Tax=Amantichitinum ursilacus TaxID=857265 RepID=A0A0N0GNQ0_9NEIS|nr:tetratricopeptide repeat protein [Amantichitinum ursilacus]KPC52965.1 hypothetical protein WG78_10760 [Amantichitinum ursilacus]
MLPRSSPNAHVEPQERARLVSRWSIAALVIVVAAGLVFLFPRESITRAAALARPEDALATDYLRSELAHHPNDVEVRQTLVGRYARAGNFAEAQRLLAPMAANPETRQQADLARVDLQEAEIATLIPGAPRSAAIDRMHALIVEVTDSWLQHRVVLKPDWLLAKLTQWAPEKLDGVYLALAQRQPADAPRWLGKAADSALAAGDYRASSNAWFAAQSAAIDPAQRRMYFMRGVSALRAGNLGSEAAVAAEAHSQEWRDDRDVLILLINLARASNNPAMADRYARRLLQMSWLHLPNGPRNAITVADYPRALPRFAFALPLRNGLLRTADTVAQPAAPATPHAAYDSESYRLAYDVFVSNKKLADALAVAQAALKAVPADEDWQRRFAQAAEWSGQPAVALAAWRKLAQQTNEDAAWQSVFRLAPSLLDDDALLAAWQHEEQQRALTDKEWLQLVTLFERIGQPIKGAQMFEAAFQRRPVPLLLEQAGWLRQREGDDAGAAQDYQRLMTQFGPRVEWATTLATLRYSHGDLEGAYQAMWQAHTVAAPDNENYWRTLGDLAWYLHHNDQARTALDHLHDQGQWQELDVERMLALLPPKDRLARQALLENAWRTFHQPDFLIDALALDMDRVDYTGAHRLLNSLEPAQLARLEANAGFLVQRARLEQAEHQLPAAQRDITAALALIPDSIELRISIIWLLVEQRDAATLSGVLPRWERAADNNPSLAEAIAAGWQSLGQLNRAIDWSRKLLPQHQDDMLWLSNYADMIEQAGQMDLAWQIRRYAWQNRDVMPARDIDTLVSRLAQTLRFEPIDKAQRTLYAAILQSQTPAGDAMSQSDRDRIDELIYSWHLGQEDDAAARFWYWKRHARQLTDPHYLELAAAVKRGDDEAIARMLARDGVATQPADQAMLAQEAGLWPLAQSLTHYHANGTPDNDALHLSLSDQLLANEPEQVNVGAVRVQGSDVTGTRMLLQGTLALTPNTRLSLAMDRAPLTYEPTGYSQINTHAVVTLSMLGPTNARGNGAEMSLSALANKGRSSYAGFVLHLAGGVEDLGWSLEAAINEQASDDGLLMLLGKQDRVTAQGSWRINRLINGEVQLGYNRFSLQDGTYLGAKTDETLALQYRLPESPFSIRGSVEAAQYSASGNTSGNYADVLPNTDTLGSPELMPQNFHRADIAIGYDLENRNTFRRDIRPFGSIGTGYHSISGRQFEWLIGLGGRVFGSDRLALYGQQNTDASGGQNREYGLNYEFYY